jgi:hypothetical protein
LKDEQFGLLTHIEMGSVSLRADEERSALLELQRAICIHLLSENLE